MISENKVSEKNLLIIFTRNPEIGKVKKRLAAGIGDAAALKIYIHLLKHTVEVTKALPIKKWVFYSEEIPQRDIWDEAVFSKKLQKGQDLGAKMEQAFYSGFEAGYENIIIIGSDLFDLTEKDLKMAFLELQQHDAVIGPATDGGYYLLGLKSIPLNIFKNKKWGSNEILSATLKDLKKLNYKLLEPRNDIDYPEDLRPYPQLTKLIEHE